MLASSRYQPIPCTFLSSPGWFKTPNHISEASEAANSAKATPSMHLVFAATLLPDVQSDAMSLLFGADQVHVVGDEEFASTCYRGAPRWYEGGGTEVGGPVDLFQLKDGERNKESLHPNLDAPEERLHSDWLLASHLLWQSFIFSGSHRRETSPGFFLCCLSIKIHYRCSRLAPD